MDKITEGAGGVGAQSRYRWRLYQKYGIERTGKTARRSRAVVWRRAKLDIDNTSGQRDSRSEVSEKLYVRVCRVHQKDQDRRGESGIPKTEKLGGQGQGDQKVK